MLFILTGDIQIGKTRWLGRLISALEEADVEVVGVRAPGTWIEHGSSNGVVHYEKTGIDNELLPSHERIPFARRADLAAAEGTLDEHSQASQANLSWAIDDSAIDRVNAHLRQLACAPSDGGMPKLLVVDELGRLELLRDGGLTAAMTLIDRGATPALPHALIVVREQLLPHARKRFAQAHWGGLQAIRPDSDAWDTLLDAYLRGNERN